MTQYALPIALISLGLTIVLGGFVIHTARALRAFTRGESGASLEGTIRRHIADADRIEKNHADIRSALTALHERILQKTVSPSIMRFNPFEGGGTNQSFSVALIDEKGDGFILSSLHTREKTSLFAKPITGYASSLELTDEERHVLEQARQRS